MNSYRTIELTNGDEWACNRLGEGVFSRRSDGTWQQHTGTGQTPTFRTAAQFSRYVRAHYRAGNGDDLPGMRRRSARNWT
jgi:hypothetical protein